jgi:hypothetical protein
MRALLVTLLCLAAPLPAAAQARIVLSEVVPALEGTELGDLEVGPAPPPGGVRTVRRSEVLAALRRAGRETRGLAIPRVTRVRRAARRLDAEALRALARPAVEAAMAPCSIESLTVTAEATVAPGALEVAAEGHAPRRSGSSALVIVLRAAGREVRVPAQARVRCPPPVVRPGARVRIVARFGAVEARAPGRARQPGRVGEVIRVRNTQSHQSLRARVVDADTVEVVP